VDGTTQVRITPHGVIAASCLLGRFDKEDSGGGLDMATPPLATAPAASGPYHAPAIASPLCAQRLSVQPLSDARRTLCKFSTMRAANYLISRTTRMWRRHYVPLGDWLNHSTNAPSEGQWPRYAVNMPYLLHHHSLTSHRAGMVLTLPRSALFDAGPRRWHAQQTISLYLYRSLRPSALCYRGVRNAGLAARQAGMPGACRMVTLSRDGVWNLCCSLQHGGRNHNAGVKLAPLAAGGAAWLPSRLPTSHLSSFSHLARTSGNGQPRITAFSTWRHAPGRAASSLTFLLGGAELKQRWTASRQLRVCSASPPLAGHDCNNYARTALAPVWQPWRHSRSSTA